MGRIAPVKKERGKGEQKGKNLDGEGTDTQNKESQSNMEHHGMLIMYKEDLEKSRKWFKQINGRLMQVAFAVKDRI